MSLPKRDGVHDRYYLIHKPDTSPEVLAEADLCIQDVLNGTARENHSAYPTVVRNHNGTPFLPDQLLERYLTGLPLKEFPCDVAVSLCDAMRRLVGWEEIRYTLEKYIEKQVQERFFLVGERDDGFTVFPPCTVLPELHPEDVDEGLLRFACYVAICHTVYGQSFESLTTEHILGLVSQIRPDMVKELKTNGSGKLPPNIQKRKTKHLTASANDAFATIRITARDCGEGACEEALSYLIEILEQPEFPRSYSIEFRGPEKIYLPSPACPRRVSISFLPVRCGIPVSMSGWRIMLGWPCRRTSGTTTSLMSPAPCLAPLPCLPWDWKGRSGGGWCAITWIAVMTSTPLCKKSLFTPFLRSTGLLLSPCRCWSTVSSPCRI